MQSSTVHRGDIDASAIVSPTATVWDHAQIRGGAVISDECIIGRGAYIGIGVHLGRACKIQNYALVYEPAQLGAGVFVGPAAVLTNDRLPRAVNHDLTIKSASDWDAVGVTVREGASIGARAVCIAPITIGEWAMIGAGSVVTRDIPAHALVVGVPAKQVGWVSKTGERLVAGATPGEWHCPSTGKRYNEVDGALTEVVK